MGVWLLALMMGAERAVPAGAVAGRFQGAMAFPGPFRVVFHFGMSALAAIQ
jgi:hypothetical protein